MSSIGDFDAQNRDIAVQIVANVNVLPVIAEHRTLGQPAHLDFVAARHFLTVDLKCDDFAVALVEPSILGRVVAVQQ